MPISPQKRQKQSLLIPSKRPLLPPTKTKPSVISPSSVPADIQFLPSSPSSSSRETATAATHNAPATATASGATDLNRDTGIPPIIEVDLSRAPQPFLDPGVWEKMRELEGRGVNEGEKEKGQGEFGGMAVRGRKAVRKMR